MKAKWFVLTMLLIAGLFFYCQSRVFGENTPQEKKLIKVLIVTGGHGFEKESFVKMFDSIPGISFVCTELKDDSEIFESIENWNYDVIVLYNMTQNISDKRRRNFLALLQQGVGVVGLHHSIANYQNWPEYRKIIGAKYYLEPTEEEGVLYARCQYKHDVQIQVKIADPNHPAVRGLSDYTILDETYKGYRMEQGNHILLTTDEPLSQKEIGWVRKYEKSRICYLQGGHGKDAYENPNFRKLLTQSIAWTANINKL